MNESLLDERRYLVSFILSRPEAAEHHPDMGPAIGNGPILQQSSQFFAGRHQGSQELVVVRALDPHDMA